MPFGAQLRNEGGVRFRLWAPKASTVGLVLEGAAAPVPMRRLEDGWFEIEQPDAAPGDLYRFRIDDGPAVPDPASRFNPFDVHGPSQVVDPQSFRWKDSGWRGRAWREAVIYELHVGAFTPEGTFRSAREKLGHLVDLGVTAVELMPVADFPGSRNWGYDAVLPYAPDSTYGRPEDLKEFVQDCHDRGLMVLLDVVYNHFGPEGNYLHLYAPAFFTERHKTPWGSAINFDGPGSRVVRDFFIHNALYWLEEYRFDGLRLDAVHSIIDNSKPHILEELADSVRRGPGSRRFCHLVLENGNNTAHYLNRDSRGASLHYNAQWNDDWHHSAHVLATGESDGYYADYVDRPVWRLGRCLAEGFAFQGESSPYHENAPRGEPSAHLPLTAFINFLQNHDQVGNRAFGERLSRIAAPEALRALSAILLLAPSPPMLFMGEEFAAEQPFLYFCDFEPGLARAVARGRREEFARFTRFSLPESRHAIPDPADPHTYAASKLDWERLADPESDSRHRMYRTLLGIRKAKIVPLFEKHPYWKGRFRQIGERGLAVDWLTADGVTLSLLANLGPEKLETGIVPEGEVLYSAGEFPGPWSAVWFLVDK